MTLLDQIRYFLDHPPPYDHTGAGVRTDMRLLLAEIDRLNEALKPVPYQCYWSRRALDAESKIAELRAEIASLGHALLMAEISQSPCPTKTTCKTSDGTGEPSK
jgi:hypothetical protein